MPDYDAVVAAEKLYSKYMACISGLAGILQSQHKDRVKFPEGNQAVDNLLKAVDRARSVLKAYGINVDKEEENENV